MRKNCCDCGTDEHIRHGQQRISIYEPVHWSSLWTSTISPILLVLWGTNQRDSTLSLASINIFDTPEALPNDRRQDIALSLSPFICGSSRLSFTSELHVSKETWFHPSTDSRCVILRFHAFCDVLILCWDLNVHQDTHVLSWVYLHS